MRRNLRACIREPLPRLPTARPMRPGASRLFISPPQWRGPRELCNFCRGGLCVTKIEVTYMSETVDIGADALERLCSKSCNLKFTIPPNPHWEIFYEESSARSHLPNAIPFVILGALLLMFSWRPILANPPTTRGTTATPAYRLPR